MSNVENVDVKLYGIVGSCSSVEMGLPRHQIEDGAQIDIRNRQYKVVSKIDLGSDQYAINLMCLTP